MFYSDLPKGMALASDGGVVLLGHTRNGGPGQYSVLLWKLDTEGNEVWKNLIGESNSDRSNKIIKLSPDGFLICGFTKSFGS